MSLFVCLFLLFVCLFLWLRIVIIVIVFGLTVFDFFLVIHRLDISLQSDISIFYVEGNIAISLGKPA